MLKFFRTIRKKLIEQDNVRKYILYAIGEILLVVIGILIALQINNWNEAQKDNRLEQTFLIKLKSNLNDDIILYKDRIERNTILYNHLDTSLTILKNHKNYSTEDLQVHLRHILFFHRFNTNKTTFDNLLSSGRLNIIGNDSLTQELFLYYRMISQNQESLAESIDAYSRYTIGPSFLEFDFVDSSLDVYLEYSKSSFSLKPIESYVENPKILNHISYKMLLINVIMNAYKRQIINAENIIDIIDSEIK